VPPPAEGAAAGVFPLTAPGGYAKMRRMKISRKMFIAAALIVLAAAGYYRFAGLGAKALHHDESVNYSFIKKVPAGDYHYNHTAYHGPLLYFAGYPAAALFNYSKAALRFMPALAGLLAVLLALLTARSLGRSGALFFAAALAVSPADVYFSKTFIHEIYLALSLVGTLWAFFEILRTQKPWALILFYLFWVIGFTAKETTAINVLAFAGALVIGWLTATYARREQALPAAAVFGHPHYRHLLWALSSGVVVWALLFTSFLTNPQGLIDFFKAYLPWFETGVKQKAHVKQWPYFLVLVPKYYWPAVPFAVWTVLHATLGRWFRWWMAPIAAFAAAAVLLLVPDQADWQHGLIAAVLLPLIVAWSADVWTMLNGSAAWETFARFHRGVVSRVIGGTRPRRKTSVWLWNLTDRPGYRLFMVSLGRLLFLAAVVGYLGLTLSRAADARYGFLLPWLALLCFRLFRLARLRTILLFVIFAAIIGAYSIIPYKTPWCVLTMGIALLALGADGVTDAWSFRRGRFWRAGVAAVVGVLLFHYAWQSYRINFWEYDFDHRRHEGNGHLLERDAVSGEIIQLAVPPAEGRWLARQADYLKHLYNPRYRSGGGSDFIYVQTLREYEKIFDDLADLAVRAGLGKKATVGLTRGKKVKGRQQPGSKNPARYYVREYQTTTLTADLDLEKKTKDWPDFVIVHTDEMRRFNKKHEQRYHEYGVYPVFPGWKVHLMVREDLWREIEEKTAAKPATSS